MKHNEYVLECFEKKIMRTVYGSISENIWRKRHNQELYTLFKDVEVSNYVKLTKLIWADHDKKVSKKCLYRLQVEGREKGQDCAGRMKMQYFWNKEMFDTARHLDEWKRLLEEAKLRN